MTSGGTGAGGTSVGAGGTVPARRRGRPSRTDAGDGPGARERILTAARAGFPARGHEKTPVRGIAEAAAVDPALPVAHVRPAVTRLTSRIRCPDLGAGA